MLDGFWKYIEAQIADLAEAKTAADVLRICPRSPDTSSGDGFFGGGDGDDVWGALFEAGWQPVWSEATYFWCMKSPGGGECCCRGDQSSTLASCVECTAGAHADCWQAGGMITYVEGDLFRGNQHPSKAGR